MIVVSDASPIIALESVGQLSLLRDLYGRVLVPSQVYREITIADKPGGPQIAATEWLEEHPLAKGTTVAALAAMLDQGEAEAIVLALEVGAELLLMDERRGRIIAQDMGCQVAGLLGVLVVAKKKGLIPELRPLLASLSRTGFRVSDTLVQQVLREVGE